MREPGGWLRRHTCPRSRPQTDVNKDTAWNPRSLTLKTCICALGCICVLTHTYTHTQGFGPYKQKHALFKQSQDIDRITDTDYTPAPQHTFHTVHYHGAEVLKQGWSCTEGTLGHVSDICSHQMGGTREAAQQHPSVPRTAPHRVWPGPNVPSAEEETLLYGKERPL